MPTATTFYMRLGVAAAKGFTLPSGALYSSTINNTNATYTGANGKYLDVNSGILQSTIATTAANMSITNPDVFAQFFTPLLASQSISSASTLKIGIGAKSATSARFHPGVGVYLVNGSTGAVRTILTTYAANNIPMSTGTAEQTAYSATLSLASATVTAGDVICVEIMGIDATGTVVSTVYFDGTTAITASGTATSSAKAFITFPAALTYTLPQAPITNIRTLGQGVTRASVW